MMKKTNRGLSVLIAGAVTLSFSGAAIAACNDATRTACEDTASAAAILLHPFSYTCSLNPLSNWICGGDYQREYRQLRDACLSRSNCDVPEDEPEDETPPTGGGDGDGFSWSAPSIPGPADMDFSSLAVGGSTGIKTGTVTIVDED